MDFKEQEIWKDVHGYEGKYQVSNTGKIRTLTPRSFHKPIFTWLVKGYKICGLWNGKKRRNEKLHRLVLETFVGKCPTGMEARHLNGDRLDCQLENLKWGTRKENSLDKLRHGTLHSILNPQKVKLIRLLKRDFKWKLTQIQRFFYPSWGVSIKTIEKAWRGQTWNRNP